ncbi:TonB-dependent receptor [Oceaniferula spumae]|uniref:TonB-dependent receptor n=1 Tax=Oceaniferula spumae TaxID=2979115 RepID=A0AAT9FQ60_9BACT
MKYTKIAFLGSATSSARFTSNIQRNTGILTLAATAASFGMACAHPEENKLPDTTIIANRTETSLTKVGSAVSVLDVTGLERDGILHLDEALKFVPGVVSESISGQRGSASSLLLRGTTTGHAHIRVDGMRISGPNITSGNFFGGSNLSGLSRIEILRGPQSALYGGDAIGGVLGIYSKKGTGTPGGSLRLEAGSFDSFTSSLGLHGQIDRLSYNLGIGHESTDNDLPNNHFEQLSYTLRLDYEVSDSLDIGLTLRGFDSEFRRPSYSDPNFARSADDDTESLLATIFAELQVNDIWKSKLALGLYDETYDSDTFGSSNYYRTEGQKYAAYWDNTLHWNDRHTTTAGLVYEKTKFEYQSLFFGLTEDDRESDQYGIYLNHSWDVTDALTLTGGVRWEDYDTYGDEVTWRAAAAYRIKQTGTKFRASVGKGFRPPSFIDIYGFGGASNFDLKAEQSIGWDVGIDQQFCEGQYQISATYFENRIEDQITSTFGPPPTFATVTFNAPGTTVTKGIELEAHAKWLDGRVRTSVAYTWLAESLQDQPEHSAGLRVSADVTDDLEAGFSVNYLDDRSWGGNEVAAYTLVNLHANYEIKPGITLNARVSNLFDEDYEFANFGSGLFQETYPGRGRGIFGGVTFVW